MKLKILKYNNTIFTSSLNCYSLNLIPIFDKPIPTSCYQFTRLMRMPKSTYTNIIMSLPFLEDLRWFPVPNEAFSIGVSRNQIAVKFEIYLYNPNFSQETKQLYKKPKVIFLTSYLVKSPNRKRNLPPYAL